VARVLLVEDNAMNRDMLSRRLARRGYEVDWAGSGEEGVAKAGSGGYDVILMDLSLPGMGGWEATRRIRAAETARPVPIVALTAHAMAGDRGDALEAGCNDYDTKPVDLDRLLGKIQALLGATP